MSHYYHTLENWKADRGFLSCIPRIPALMVEAPLSRTTAGMLVGGIACYIVRLTPDGEVNDENVGQCRVR